MTKHTCSGKEGGIQLFFFFFFFLAGKLVIADTGRPIVLRTKHILIGNKGELHIGSPDCPYKGKLTISLYGRYGESPVMR